MPTVYDNPATLLASQTAAAHLRLTLLDDHAGAATVLADSDLDPELFAWALSRYTALVMTEAIGSAHGALATIDNLIARLHHTNRQENQ